MNCKDISRLIDGGLFTTLADAERREGEAHALVCVQCAPLWIAHTRLAALSIPPLPPELAVRCLTLAAAQSQAFKPRYAPRRMIFVVGSLVALAAAAGILAVSRYSSAPLNPPAPSVSPTAAMPDAPVPVQDPSPIAVIEAIPELSARTTEVVKTLESSLPLLPMPVARQPTYELDLALQKAVELYPELVEGPDTDGSFVVSIATRPDGEVLVSNLRTATRDTQSEVANEQARSVLPRDGGGSITFTSRSKGALLPGGRALRGHLSLQFTTVSETFDSSRSSDRVQQILRQGHIHLLAPANGEGVNYLTVLLSDDGTIQREHLDFRRFEDLKQVRPSDPADVNGFAAGIAGKLGIDIDQIGLMGTTTLEEGQMAVSVDASGNLRPIGNRRMLAVNYAWLRRVGESAPTLGQGTGVVRSPGIDLIAALAIVERVLPDAFTQTGLSRGEPTVVLSVEGKVIGAGRVNNLNPEERTRQLQQIAPGVMLAAYSSARLVNSVGAKADVQFAWEAPPLMRESMEKVGVKPPGR